MVDSPIIIIGAARSGTKFLRDTIAQDSAIDCVPYDVNYVWRTGQLNKPDDVLLPESIDDFTAEKIRTTLQTLSSVPNNSNNQMIEKTVSNALRIPFVDRVYPQARYIHLVRNGYAVIESAQRLWQAPPNTGGLTKKLRELPINQYGYVLWFAMNYLKGIFRGRSGGEVWGPRYPNIAADVAKEELLVVVARQWNWCVKKAHEDLSTLPAERVLTIKFEDLATREDQAHKLAGFVGASNAKEMADSIRKGFDPKHLNKWRDRLSAKEMNTIELEADEGLRIFGYHEDQGTGT